MTLKAFPIVALALLGLTSLGACASTSETYPAKPAGEASEFVPVWTTKRAFPMLA